MKNKHVDFFVVIFALSEKPFGQEFERTNSETKWLLFFLCAVLVFFSTHREEQNE
jgi:hypothetical protein